jgi:hypothetical protein
VVRGVGDGFGEVRRVEKFEGVDAFHDGFA